MGATAQSAKPPLRRLTIREYEDFAAAGSFEGRHVELLEGIVCERMSSNPPHDATLAQVVELLQRRIPSGYTVLFQGPVTTIDSRPEPDVIVVRGDRGQWFRRRPAPGDVVPAVELSDTTLRTDRATKARVYARAGIPVYRIINLVDDVVELRTRPVAGRNPRYQDPPEDVRRDDELALTLGETTLTFFGRDLLPPEPTEDEG